MPMQMTGKLGELKSKGAKRLLNALLTVPPRENLERLGSDYGGWIVPADLIKPDWICYCAGVGEDITFDLELIKRFSCNVFAFDPTPRSKAHVERVAGTNPKYHFFKFGLWSSDARLKFYAPRDPDHVSHSILNLQGTTEYFEAECKRLSTIAKELGHDHVDLLKLDIEGAEHEVLKNLMEEDVAVKVLCVEFNQPAAFSMILKMVRTLQSWKYSLVAVDGWNLTFLDRSILKEHANAALAS